MLTLPFDPKLINCPVKFALPETLSPVNVPTEVILGCAAVVTVPAVVALVAVPALVANVAFATVPVTLAPAIFDSPLICEPDESVQLPVIVPVVTLEPVDKVLPLKIVELPSAPTLPV